MSYPETAIDKVSFELADLAQKWAEALALDPYFREAIVKSAVSSFVWALYHAFTDPMDRAALDAELKTQSSAITGAVTPSSQLP